MTHGFPYKTVLVTGGAGFVGHHLVRRLLKMNCRVHVLDDLSTGRRENVPEDAVFFEGDIRDLRDSAEAIQGCEAVFHLAARVELQRSVEDPVDCFSVNVDGTARIIEQALRYEVGRFVFTSSCAVYPLNSAEPLSEDMATIGDTPYALSKRAGEQILHIFGRLRGLCGCSLRCFNIYGPGQRLDGPYAAVIPKFISKAMRGEPLALNGGGTQTRDFIHVEDVVEAFLLAASQRDDGVFNTGTGRATSVRDLAVLIQQIEGKSSLVAKPALPGDAASSQANIGRIQKTFGFEPKQRLESAIPQLYNVMRTSVGDISHEL